ncbi:MAG: hypothetical protein NTY93_00630 [Candidatus Kaiserbacteria bacterium]|nr:hypothetical protein [Candidatus Kaiserbacteria bacterium]
MKIFLICSKKFYSRIPDIQTELESRGYVITLPNSYDDSTAEEKYKSLGATEHSKWKAEMLQHSTDVVENNDAVLVLNFEKNGIENYIGGATFLEMYDAFRLNKTIFLFNPIPDGILRDEIEGFSPVIINGDLSRIK